MGIFSFICYSVYFRNINSLNCISLSLIPKHSFFHAIVNEIFPLISFFSLPIADIENPTDFCFTAWYPAALLKSANQTSQVSVESLVFSTYNIMSPANSCLLLSVQFRHILFLCHLWLSDQNVLCNEEEWWLALSPSCERNFQELTVKYSVYCGFSPTRLFIMFKHFSSVPSSQVLPHDRILNSVK